MNAIARGGWLAAAGSAGVVWLLLFPLQAASGSWYWRVGGHMAHVLLFAGLAWLWGRVFPKWARGGLLWVLLAVVAASLEWLQSRMGRSAELVDWVYGAGGAACVCATWRMGSPRRLRWIGVTALCLFPLLWGGLMVQMEKTAFPVLSNPDSIWARRGWALRGVRMAAGTNGLHLQAVAGTDEAPTQYPGLFRTPAAGDWRKWSSLNADLFWPMEDPVLFAVRVDDLPGNPPYANRFQREFSVTQGWNAIRIPIDEFKWTSGRRLMHLETVRQWGVFLVSDTPFDYFLLGAVRLERPEEQP